MFIFVLPGMVAAALYTDVRAGAGDSAYPALVTRLLPAGFKGLVLAGMLAALMSSLASAFNSCSTLLTWDVYRKLKPHATEAELVTFGHAHDKHPLALASSVLDHPVLAGDAITSLALSTGSASLERIASGTAIDAGGLVPDLASINSWTQVLDEVDPLEMLEVQLCNVTAPFLLVSRLRGAMKRSTARRKYIVNVSAMEGQFSRAYKGPGHPHTNMAKAALNMMTRTSAQEMLDADGILMTAVDTGWITDERPHYTKVRLMEEGFHAPLDLVDGAARVYDPIVMGESGEDQYGVFLKDYKPSPW